MLARRSNDDLGIAAGAFFLLLLVASAIATAWQTWTGRLLLLVVFGGGGWLAVVSVDTPPATHRRPDAGADGAPVGRSWRCPDGLDHLPHPPGT